MSYLREKLNLDHIRIILSFMIIAIHTFPLTFISDELDYLITRVLFRIAVPIYLMITGYYLLAKSFQNKKILLKYLKKVSVIYILSILLYGVFLLKTHPSIIEIIKSLLFTGPLYHLWYFPALILGIIVTYIIIKYIPKKYQAVVGILLYFIGILGDNYYGFIENINLFKGFYSIITNIFGYTRNFIFYVPIFLLLGYKISCEKNSTKKDENILYIVVFSLLMLVEGTIIYYSPLGSPLHTSMYVSLPFLSYFIFKYFMTYLNDGENKNLRKLSTYIYILHPWIIIILTKLRFIGLIDNSLIFFLLVSLITYYVSLLFAKIVKKREK